MRGDQLALQWRIIRSIEASAKGLTLAELSIRFSRRLFFVQDATISPTLKSWPFSSIDHLGWPNPTRGKRLFPGGAFQMYSHWTCVSDPRQLEMQPRMNLGGIWSRDSKLGAVAPTPC